MSYRVVFCTCPPDVAPDVARQVVESKLAACVNILPGVRSIYRWEGQICDDGESLLVIKTAADRVDALCDRILEVHPYDVPEVIALPVEPDEGNPAYLKWVKAESHG